MLVDIQDLSACLMMGIVHLLCGVCVYIMDYDNFNIYNDNSL